MKGVNFPRPSRLWKLRKTAVERLQRSSYPSYRHVKPDYEWRAHFARRGSTSTFTQGMKGVHCQRHTGLLIALQTVKSTTVGECFDFLLSCHRYGNTLCEINDHTLFHITLQLTQSNNDIVHNNKASRQHCSRNTTLERSNGLIVEMSSPSDLAPEQGVFPDSGSTVWILRKGNVTNGNSSYVRN